MKAKRRSVVRAMYRTAIKGFLVLALCAFCVGVGKGTPQMGQRTGFAKEQQSVSTVSSEEKAIGSKVSPPTLENVLVDEDFKIGPDDVIAVNVWREPEVSQTLPVRPDGKISLPLAGEVVASGLTAKQLESTITQQLSIYLSRPEVTVIVREVKSQRVVVAGQVAKPGSYPLLTGMSVLDAIAQAGGPLEYAKVKSMYVLRTGPDGKPVRLKFNYKQVIHGQSLTQNIRLQPHDTVVVP